MLIYTCGRQKTIPTDDRYKIRTSVGTQGGLSYKEALRFAQATEFDLNGQPTGDNATITPDNRLTFITIPKKPTLLGTSL